MPAQDEKKLAEGGKRAQVSALWRQGITFLGDRLMLKNPAIEAAKTFGQRLANGEVTMLSPEESTRSLDATIQHLDSMEKALKQLRKNPKP